MLEMDSTWHLFFSERHIGGVEESGRDSELEKDCGTKGKTGAA